MEEKDYKRLWRRIVLTILGFSLIPLFAVGITIYYQFSVSYTAKIIENLKTLVENRRSALDLFFDERIAQLVTIAHTHTLKQLSEEKYLDNIFRAMQTRSKSYIDLGVVDREGDHLAYVGPHPELKGVNYREEDWFQSVLSRGVYISDVFMGFRKLPHFIIAVRGRDGEKTWILRATINTEIIDNIVRAAQIGRKGDAFIINKANICQTAPRFCGELFGRPKAPDFSGTRETQVEQIVTNGGKSFFAAAEISNTKWILVAKEEPGELLTPLREARFTALALFLSGIFIIVLGTLMTTRSMMKQLIRVDRERAANEHMIIQSSKMAALGKMAAGVAHEINNPLAVIREKAGWMKDLLAEEEISRSENIKQFEDAISKIESHVDRAKKVTHRLLGFARRVEPMREQVDVNKALSDTIELLGNESLYRNIDIELDAQPDLPTIKSEFSQLQQVFLNVIDNAIDAIDKDGKIKVKTSFLPTNGEVLIEIADNGPGIAKEHLGKIFDPFFTTKEIGKGTGLGLSIVYSIVQKLGGRITVASEVGKGTSFTICFPVA
jgi:two-component system NtrC family sensor kinase